MKALVDLRFIILLSCISLYTTLTLAQSQGNIWYFSKELGLNFNTSPPQVLFDGVIDHNGGGTEGVSSIASIDGNVLFYCNGEKIWNRKHQVMKNGDGLLGNYSSTNGAVIVPRPGENNEYYIFTTPGWQDDLPFGLRYSIVDMCGDNGYGEVISEVKNIALLDGAGEKLAFTKHANGIDYWLVSHKHFSSDFYSYLITENGISTPVISSVGTFHGRDGYQDAIGQMKISSDGTQLALVMENREPDVVDLFTFDNSTGQLSNYVDLSDGSASGGIYGLAFSDDGSKIYYNGRDGLYQLALDAGNSRSDIIQSKYKIAEREGLGGLQLGPDKKIYVVSFEYISVIQTPNLPGAACSFDSHAIYLDGRMAVFAFPTFLDNFDYPDKGYLPLEVNLHDTTICPGESILYNAISRGHDVHYLWDNGTTNSIREFSVAGKYAVKISDRFCTMQKDIIVTAPIFDESADSKTACAGAQVLLSNSTQGATFQWQDGSSNSSLQVDRAGTYWVDVKKTGCIFRDSIEVIYFNPQFYLGPDTVLCDGNTLRLSIEIDADQFEWQDGSNSSYYEVTHAGKYLATAKLHGCTYTDDINIQYLSATKISLGRDTTLCEGDMLKISLDSQEAYFWSNGSVGNSIAISETGIYWANAPQKNCEVADTISVEVIPCEMTLPNIFTPNEDGYNKTFIPMSASGIRSAKLSIFDRWGTEIYEDDHFSINHGWNGVAQGIPAPSGVYFWLVQYTVINNKSILLKGTVTLQR